ncbi:MAG: isoprenylcysteine carboxylmethyltransferase family protein [Anaerolineales bacterium]|nr:isoprenylcysteine carboxylmethyltransferase family protein [Anaerolineales bacterium]
MNETKPDIPQRVVDRKEIALMTIESAAFIGQIILCFLYYNWLHQSILLYFGWACLILSAIPGWRGRTEFESFGKAKQGEKWMRTTVVVDTGIYQVVRHPMYLSFMLMSFALICISQHWLSLILGVILIFLIYDDMRREEALNLNKFGEKYRQYMQRTPRMNFVLGIIRYFQRKKQG